MAREPGMALREQLVHVSRRVERGELLIAREGGHDPDFELIEVHIAQLRAFASADDGPIFLGHALERRVAQEYARRAGPEDVNDRGRAPASQGQGREQDWTRKR